MPRRARNRPAVRSSFGEAEPRPRERCGPGVETRAGGRRRTDSPDLWESVPPTCAAAERSLLLPVRARMCRTVADETVRPDALTRSDEGTGSPSAMYSRTRAARIRLDRSEGPISTRDLRLLSNYTHQPGSGVRWVSDGCLTPPQLIVGRIRGERIRQVGRGERGLERPDGPRRSPRPGSTRSGLPFSTSSSPSTIVVVTSVPLRCVDER